MRRLILLWVIASCGFASAEVLWKKDFWAWGQGANTNLATSKALEAAKPQISDMRVGCTTEKGLLTYTTTGGYCTTLTDPMHCPAGCYTCPIYGTATCTYDNTADFKIGALVEVIRDANLQVGTTIVGKVKTGEKYHIAKIQKPWINMEKLDGTAVNGWVQMENLKVITE